MKNYILADYRRILTRVPRLLFLAVYEIAIIISVISAWKDAPVFTSLDFFNATSLWFTGMGSLMLGVGALINVFGDDFKCKTMQVAIGIGVTRLQVVVSKLIQCAMILVTDLLVTCAVLGVLTLVTGVSLAPHQYFQIFADCVYILLFAVCWASVISALIFKLQSMLLPMVIFVLMNFNLLDFLLRSLTRSNIELLQRLHLEYYTPAYFADTIRTNMLMTKLDVTPVFGLFVWIALGVAAAYMIFRKQELDF